jgi:hypothetical protein
MTKKQIKELTAKLYWRLLEDYNISATDDELDDLVNSSDELDFCIVLDGNEYRFIDGKFIWDIYVEEIQQVTEECYLDGMDTDKLWWIAIDWEKTAENCLDADGYGHHFASYDGDELEIMLNGDLYYFFRTN